MILIVLKLALVHLNESSLQVILDAVALALALDKLTLEHDLALALLPFYHANPRIACKLFETLNLILLIAFLHILEQILILLLIASVLQFHGARLFFWILGFVQPGLQGQLRLGVVGVVGSQNCRVEHWEQFRGDGQRQGGELGRRLKLIPHLLYIRVVKSDYRLEQSGIFPGLDILGGDLLRRTDQLDHAHELLNGKKHSSDPEPCSEHRYSRRAASQLLLEIGDVAEGHEQPVAGTQCKQDLLVVVVQVEQPEAAGRFLVVQPRGEGGIHLVPVRGQVQQDVSVEDERVLRVQGAQKGQDHCIGGAIAHHVQHGTEVGGLVILAGSHAVDCIQGGREAPEDQGQHGLVPVGEDGGKDEGVAQVPDHIRDEQEHVVRLDHDNTYYKSAAKREHQKT